LSTQPSFTYGQAIITSGPPCGSRPLSARSTPSSRFKVTHDIFGKKSSNEKPTEEEKQQVPHSIAQEESATLSAQLVEAFKELIIDENILSAALGKINLHFQLTLLRQNIHRGPA